MLVNLRVRTHLGTTVITQFASGIGQITCEHIEFESASNTGLAVTYTKFSRETRMRKAGGSIKSERRSR